jgi:hypothetical protein
MNIYDDDRDGHLGSMPASRLFVGAAGLCLRCLRMRRFLVGFNCNYLGSARIKNSG